MTLQHKKICITGASGYLASHLICKLLPNNILHVITRNKEHFIQHCVPAIYGKDSDLSNSIINLHVFESDYINEIPIIQALTGCDYLIHCASPVILTRYMDAELNKTHIIKPAIQITETLLNCVNKTSISTVLYTSSTCAVYSKYKRKMSPIDWADDSNTDPYTISKLLSEKKAWELSQNAKWKLIVMLPGRIIGPLIYKNIPESYVSITDVINSGNVLVNYHSSYCDIRDVVSVYEVFLEKHVSQGRYIIAFSVHSLKDYYDIINTITPLPSKLFTYIDDTFEFDMSSTLEIYPIKSIPFQTSICDSLHYIKI